MATTELARTLTRLRRQSGLSMRQLEERSGVGRALISLTESGERRPKATTLQKLAAAMNADAAELLVAAGYSGTHAEALPPMPVYLRTKYGHLSAAARKELAATVARLEAEQAAKPKRKR